MDRWASYTDGSAYPNSEPNLALEQVEDKYAEPYSDGCYAVDIVEKDPHVKRIFKIFCGSQPVLFPGSQPSMDGKSFMKLCRDIKAIDNRSFWAADVDLIFARIVAKGQRRIGFQQFVVGLELIAQRKDMELRDLHATLGEITGPTLYATRAEPTRFYDGLPADVDMTAPRRSIQAASYPDSPVAPRSRSRIQSAAEEKLAAEAAWRAHVEAGGVDMTDTFAAFTGLHPLMDGKTFVKLLSDCELFNKDFTTTDADLIFAKMVPKGQRRIDLQQFGIAMMMVATRLRAPPREVCEIVSTSVGPMLNATTSPERGRIYDFRGNVSINKGSFYAWDDAPPGEQSLSRDTTPRRRARSMSPGIRVNELREEMASPIHAISVKHPFQAYCGLSPGMNGKCFFKLCKDAPLLGEGFSPADVDIIFATVVPNGTRNMNLHQFEAALDLVAERKGQRTEDVLNLVAASAGPILQATRTESVRFYDDRCAQTFSSSMRCS